MASNLNKFNGRFSDSPQEMRRIIQEIQPHGAMPGPRGRNEEDEKMTAFLRSKFGVRFDGDPPVEAAS
jgi:hypothetical protein